MNSKLGAAITILSVLISPAFAETEEPSNTYLGVKGGILNISRDIPFDSDGVSLGVLFGIDFPDNSFAFEGEFNTTVSKASSQVDRYNDLSVTTLAGYGVYRSSGRLYVKGKLGLVYEYLRSSVSGAGTTIDVDGSGMGISIGLGGGIRVNDRLSAEFEYTIIEEDIGYASFGINWDL